MLEILLSMLTVSGATLALVYLLEFALRPGRGHDVAGVFFVAVLVYLGAVAFEDFYSDEDYPDWLYSVCLTGYCALGPFGLLFMRTLLDPDYEPWNTIPWAPGLVVAYSLLTITLLYFPPAWFGAAGPGLMLEWGAFWMNLVCFLVVGWFLFRLRPAPENRALRWHATVLCAMVVGIVFLEAFVSYYAAAAAVVVPLLYGRILGLFQPRLGPSLEAEGIKEKYRHSKLTGMDREALCELLERLLKEERIYAREGLTLSETARLMDLSPHQLSELVNVSYSRSFKAYLNEYRVTVARELLLRQPERDVTTIAFDAGFQSLSSFYRAFKLVHGVSPNEVRRRSA
jgi:AraC-like DNA-binding protein